MLWSWNNTQKKKNIISDSPFAKPLKERKLKLPMEEKVLWRRSKAGETALIWEPMRSGKGLEWLKRGREVTKERRRRWEETGGDLKEEEGKEERKEKRREREEEEEAALAKYMVDGSWRIWRRRWWRGLRAACHSLCNIYDERETLYVLLRH